MCRMRRHVWAPFASSHSLDNHCISLPFLVIIYLFFFDDLSPSDFFPHHFHIWRLFPWFHRKIAPPMASPHGRTTFTANGFSPSNWESWEEPKDAVQDMVQDAVRLCDFSWKTIGSRVFSPSYAPKNYQTPMILMGDLVSPEAEMAETCWNQSIETAFKLQWQLWKPLWAQWTPWEPTKTPLHRPLKSCKLLKHGKTCHDFIALTPILSIFLGGAVQATHWYNLYHPSWDMGPTGRLLVLDWTLDSSLAARISAIQPAAGWIMFRSGESPRVFLREIYPTWLCLLHSHGIDGPNRNR